MFFNSVDPFLRTLDLMASLAKYRNLMHLRIQARPRIQPTLLPGTFLTLQCRLLEVRSMGRCRNGRRALEQNIRNCVHLIVIWHTTIIGEDAYVIIL